MFFNDPTVKKLLPLLLLCVAMIPELRAQNYFAQLRNYTPSPALTQSSNIGFEAATGITGTFNVAFATTLPWAATTTTSSFFGLPTGTPVPGNPTGVAVPVSFFTSFVTSAIPAATAQIDFLGFKGTAGSTTLITLDFNGLSTGFLPAGSKLAWVDTDFGETTTLTGSAGWYSAVIGRGDITNGAQTGTSETDPTTPFLNLDTTSPTSLLLSGLAGATDSPAAIITTLNNLTSLTIAVASPVNNANYFQGFSVAVIPEPGTVGLLALAGAALGVKMRRKRREG